MYTWKSNNNSNGSRIWTRPLGPSEEAFYYTGESAGASDVLHHAVFEMNHSSPITEESVRGTWPRLKRKYPLLASRVEELDDDEESSEDDEDEDDELGGDPSPEPPPD